MPGAGLKCFNHFMGYRSVVLLVDCLESLMIIMTHFVFNIRIRIVLQLSPSSSKNIKI